MTGGKPDIQIHYRMPAASTERRKQFLVHGNGSRERRFIFYDRIEIGRYAGERDHQPGLLLLADPTVSSRHCVITQASDGRCFIRDTSRNGTRLDGKRLVPHVEVEFAAGQSISIGHGHTFTLAGEAPIPGKPVQRTDWFETVSRPETAHVTVLVGDIMNYTVMVQKVDLNAVQPAIRRVFHRLENAVTRLGGTVKEFRGDAIFAFWEQGQSRNQAVSACRAALKLDALVREIARDRTVWNISDFPLEMHWALATGTVTIATTGDDRPTGLAVIGRPVVLAFRLEKFAGGDTGSIVTCPATHDEAAEEFRFRDLGGRRSKGFEEMNRVYALVGPR